MMPRGIPGSGKAKTTAKALPLRSAGPEKRMGGPLKTMLPVEEGSAQNVNEDQLTNGAADFVESALPYVVTIKIRGNADLMFHRWNSEAVDEKATAAKNSAAKKTDNVESYVYRDEAGYICLPGEYLRQAIIGAAKFKADPRSPRKSAMDLYKAALVSLTNLASLGSKQWDYLDRRRVVVQRNGINRTRPCMKVGWTAQIKFMVTLPEYISPASLHETVTLAGRIGGLGDFRPTYGRFQVDQFSVSES